VWNWPFSRILGDIRDHYDRLAIALNLVAHLLPINRDYHRELATYC
jgi:hypothetical protein